MQILNSKQGSEGFFTRIARVSKINADCTRTQLTGNNMEQLENARCWTLGERSSSFLATDTNKSIVMSGIDTLQTTHLIM